MLGAADELLARRRRPGYLRALADARDRMPPGAVPCWQRGGLGEHLDWLRARSDAGDGLPSCGWPSYC